MTVLKETLARVDGELLAMSYSTHSVGTIAMKTEELSRLLINAYRANQLCVVPSVEVIADLEDEIADAISDSFDVDWTARDAARHVVGLLERKGLANLLTHGGEHGR